MKKYFLFFMALVGISVLILNVGKVNADPTRTIPYRFKAALHVPTVISSTGATVFKITGRATSSNGFWVAYDALSVATATYAGVGSTDYSAINIVAEGGEATQYDSFDTIDFGPEGVNFNTGVTIVTTTCDVAVLYR